METREAVQWMIENREDWRLFFVMSCEGGYDRLTSQAWQWQEELKSRGRKVTEVAVEDALLELAHTLLPDSPAGEDPKRYLFNRAARWLRGKPFRTSDTEDDVLNEAFYRSLPEFREALRAWVRAGLGKRAA